MSANNIAIHPSKHKIAIHEQVTIYYGESRQKQGFSKTRARRAQAFLIRAPNTSSVVWPGCYGEYDVPANIEPNSVLTMEPHDASQRENWPNPQITNALPGKSEF